MNSGELGVLVVDAATERKLLRRIDLNIMPVRKLKYHKFALSHHLPAKEK